METLSTDFHIRNENQKQARVREKRMFNLLNYGG